MERAEKDILSHILSVYKADRAVSARFTLSAPRATLGLAFHRGGGSPHPDVHGGALLDPGGAGRTRADRPRRHRRAAARRSAHHLLFAFHRADTASRGHFGPQRRKALGSSDRLLAWRRRQGDPALLLAPVDARRRARPGDVGPAEPVDPEEETGCSGARAGIDDGIAGRRDHHPKPGMAALGGAHGGSAAGPPAPRPSCSGVDRRDGTSARAVRRQDRPDHGADARATGRTLVDLHPGTGQRDVENDLLRKVPDPLR